MVVTTTTHDKKDSLRLSFTSVKQLCEDKRRSVLSGDDDGGDKLPLSLSRNSSWLNICASSGVRVGGVESGMIAQPFQHRLIIKKCSFPA